MYHPMFVTNEAIRLNAGAGTSRTARRGALFAAGLLVIGVGMPCANAAPQLDIMVSYAGGTPMSISGATGTVVDLPLSGYDGLTGTIDAEATFDGQGPYVTFNTGQLTAGAGGTTSSLKIDVSLINLTGPRNGFFSGSDTEIFATNSSAAINFYYDTTSTAYYNPSTSIAIGSDSFTGTLNKSTSHASDFDYDNVTFSQTSYSISEEIGLTAGANGRPQVQTSLQFYDAVPEPPSLIALLAGLSGIGVIRLASRRRRGEIASA
jgi:hypothetical protein